MSTEAKQMLRRKENDEKFDQKMRIRNNEVLLPDDDDGEEGHLKRRGSIRTLAAGAVAEIHVVVTVNIQKHL